MAYKGTTEIASGLKTMGVGGYPLVDAKDVRVTDTKRLDEALNGKLDGADVSAAVDAWLDEHPEADFAFSGNFQVSATSSYARGATPEYIKELQKDYRYLFMSNLVGAPSNTIFRRSTGACFDEKSNWASDVFLYFEVLKKREHFNE